MPRPPRSRWWPRPARGCRSPTTASNRPSPRCPSAPCRTTAAAVPSRVHYTTIVAAGVARTFVARIAADAAVADDRPSRRPSGPSETIGPSETMGPSSMGVGSERRIGSQRRSAGLRPTGEARGRFLDNWSIARPSGATRRGSARRAGGTRAVLGIVGRRQRLGFEHDLAQRQRRSPRRRIGGHVVPRGKARPRSNFLRPRRSRSNDSRGSWPRRAGQRCVASTLPPRTRWQVM